MAEKKIAVFNEVYLTCNAKDWPGVKWICIFIDLQYQLHELERWAENWETHHEGRRHATYWRQEKRTTNGKKFTQGQEVAESHDRLHNCIRKKIRDVALLSTIGRYGPGIINEIFRHQFSFQIPKVGNKGHGKVHLWKKSIYLYIQGCQHHLGCNIREMYRNNH